MRFLLRNVCLGLVAGSKIGFVAGCMAAQVPVHHHAHNYGPVETGVSVTLLAATLGGLGGVSWPIREARVRPSPRARAGVAVLCCLLGTMGLLVGGFL
jgi:hypothetical protein